jgi:hypothetical protein
MKIFDPLLNRFYDEDGREYTPSVPGVNEPAQPESTVTASDPAVEGNNNVSTL